MQNTETKKCLLCPRKCAVDRSEGFGFCGVSDKIKVARASLHLWEEPCISGQNGAGTVFFSGCNLGCVYCQNSKISTGGFGKEITSERLRELFSELIEKGAHNIELVTPTHFIPQIIKALTPKLPVPVIYNCGGYEDVNSLKKLEGLIDIYMPDMKYSIDAVAEKYSSAKDYCEKNLTAIEEMYRQVGDCEFDKNGLITKGVVVRHLILPDNALNTKGVIKNFSEISKGRKMLFSLMAQYTPCQSLDKNKFPELARAITERELLSAQKYSERFPEIEGYCQEVSSSSEIYIPDFDLSGI